MWKFKSSLSAFILCSIIFDTQAQKLQTQININQSPIITGENASVILQQIPERQLRNLQRLSNQLESTLSKTTTQKAETALKSGNYALAADSWGDIANDAILIKKSKQNWQYAVVKKAEAEEHYDIGTARKTVEAALKIAPQNTLLLEKAAILDLNLYQLESARNRLQQLENILKNTKNASTTAFLVNFRLSIIHASLGRTFEQIRYATNASKIFNEELPKTEQELYLGDITFLQESAIISQIERLDKNQELLREYQRTQSIIDPNTKTYHLTKSSLKHWISIETGVIERIPKNPGLTDVNTNKEFHNVDLIIGEYQSKLGKLFSEYLAEAKLITDVDSSLAKRISHRLYDDLLELSATCTNCSEYARRRYLASFMLGMYYFTTQNFAEANFYLSKAFNELRAAGPEGSIHVTKLQALILEKISEARREQFEWIGNPFAMNTIHQPLEGALQLLEKAYYKDQNEGSTLSGIIRISNQLRKAHVKAFNFTTASKHCDRTYDLYLQTVGNQLVADESYNDFYECQLHLLIHNRQQNPDAEQRIYSQLVDVALRTKQIQTTVELDWLKPNSNEPEVTSEVNTDSTTEQNSNLTPQK